MSLTTLTSLYGSSPQVSARGYLVHTQLVEASQIIPRVIQGPHLKINNQGNFPMTLNI